MAVRIICIKKDNGNHMNLHEAITNLGWVNEETRASGNSTREQIVEFLEKQNGTAYVKDDTTGKIAYLIVKTSVLGNKYVKTISDGVESDNLLYLDKC